MSAIALIGCVPVPPEKISFVESELSRIGNQVVGRSEIGDYYKSKLTESGFSSSITPGADGSHWVTVSSQYFLYWGEELSPDEEDEFQELTERIWWIEQSIATKLGMTLALALA